MSTLNVTSIQNPAAPQANLSLNADGTVTLPVFTGPSAPLLFQAGTLWFDTAGPTLLVRNPGNTAWVSAGGGGGGTVTGVTATAPLVSSGGAAPNLTINAATTGALGAVQIGTNLQVTGGTISIFDASDTQKGVVEMATAAEAAAGTSVTLAAPVAFSVPKDAANMTGAAILPSGTNAQRVAIATPVVGMTRFNTDSGYEEVYTGATGGWKQFNFVPRSGVAPTDLTISANTTLSGVVSVNNLTIDSGVTVTVGSQALQFVCEGTATINGSIVADATGPAGGPSSGATNGIQLAGNSGFGVGPGLGTLIPTESNPYPVLVSLTGSGGASGASYTSGSGDVGRGGSGGIGGGAVIITASGAITLGATASISAKGGIGGNASGSGSFNAGGGGGGSGGSIVLQSNVSLVTAGTLNVSGGNGGNASLTVLPGAGGGGGGAGGVIILQSPALTNGSTNTVSGGTAGVDAGTGGAGGKYGGSGGSFGEKGGTASTTPAAAGAAGYVAFAGSPV